MRRGYVQLDTLDLGARFTIPTGRVGTLKALTPGGAWVRYDADPPLTFGDGTLLTRPAESVMISRHTEVKPHA